MVFENSWIKCFEPEEKGLFPGTKVHYSECISCPIKECAAKGLLFSHCFPANIDAEKAPLNKKVMELNNALKRRKKGVSQLYCPKKKNATTNCTARTTFCKYNVICGRNTGAKKDSFIRSIRWRKVMIYVVKYLDGTSGVVNRGEFNAVDINKVEKVYTANYEVQIVSELVPIGEESSKLDETVSAFREKYNGNVVTHDGMVDFADWFDSAANGDSAVIPEKILVPQKTYKVVKVKSVPKLSGKKGLPEKEFSPSNKEEKVSDEKKDQPVQSKSAHEKPAKTKKVEIEKNDQPSLFEQNEKSDQPETPKKKRGRTREKKD
jgi:hypothetical protein